MLHTHKQLRRKIQRVDELLECLDHCIIENNIKLPPIVKVCLREIAKTIQSKHTPDYFKIN